MYATTSPFQARISTCELTRQREEESERVVSLMLALGATGSPPNLSAVVEVYPTAEPLARLVEGVWLPTIVAFLFLLLSSSRFGEAATLGIKVGYPQLSGGSIPLWVINDNKLDQRYGVEVKTIYIAGGATLLAAWLG